MTVIVACGPRRTRVVSCEDFERPRRISHSLVWKDFGDREVVDRDQLKPINVKRLLEFVGHPQFVTPLPLFELVTANANVLDGIRMIAHSRRFPVAHLTAAHESGHELEPFAVPGVEIRTR